MIASLLELAAFCSIVGLICGAIPSLHPATDSLAHFRIRFAVLLGIVLILLVVVWRGKWRFVAAIAALAIGISVRSAVSPDLPTSAPAAELRLVQLNLYFRNSAMASATEYLGKIDADIVTLQEVTPENHALFETALADEYPFQHYCPTEAIGGVAILSKFPFLAGEGGCSEARGLGWERIETPNGPLTVAALHLFWPWPKGQHTQLDGLESTMRAIEGPMIVAGDFNAAPWSHAVDRVAKASRTLVVPGFRITIEVRLVDWLPALPIPIDHVLVSDEVCGLAAHVGPDVGSDHYPVVVDLGWYDPTSSTGCSQYR